MKQRFGPHVLVFLAPALIVYTAFSAWPLVDTLRLALYGTDESGGMHFAGLANFHKLLFDAHWFAAFRNALVDNVEFFAIHTLVQNPVALLLAALLSVVVIGFAWQLILSPLWGVAEKLMGFVGLADHFQPWLGQEDTALPTIALISVWQFVGVPLMLIYAALIAIPEEVVEAAAVEGAGAWRIFWQIRLPLIAPTLGLVNILTFVGNFNAFDLIYAVKGAIAGPNFSTDLLGTLFYRTFFGYQSEVGSATMGAALATLMFLVILAGVGLYFLVIQRRLQRLAS